MQNLKLDRPLVCFDLETTGTDTENDRIVQIGLVRIEPSGERRSYESLVNPGQPIPPEATRIHGIADADVRDQPTFGGLLGELEALLAGADLAGFNSNRFDLPLLEAELRRAGSNLDLSQARRLDAMAIFHLKEPRDLAAAYRFYCGGELIDAHSALADAQAALAVLDAQIAHYGDLPADAQGLHELCNRDDDRFVDRTRKFVWNALGEAVFAFGKVKGKTLREVAANGADRGYLEWMLTRDFPDPVKQIVRDALNDVFPRRLA
jgi:DNA polymerase-3 subunit epsilon